jgi:hypothetical protein
MGAMVRTDDLASSSSILYLISSLVFVRHWFHRVCFVWIDLTESGAQRYTAVHLFIYFSCYMFHNSNPTMST